MKSKSNIDFYLRLLKSIFFRFAIGSVVFILVILAIIGIKRLVNDGQNITVLTTKKIIEENNKERKVLITEKITEELPGNANRNFLLRILSQVENVEHLVAIIGLIALTIDIPKQHKRTHYEVWQVINSSQGQGGSGGRIKALEYLNLQEENMAGLTAFNADLTGIKLQKAQLSRANLRNTRLNDSNFSGANLKEAKLSGAKLRNINLKESDLSGANLAQAKLESANLLKANLSAANLRDADLIDAQLNYADFTNANLHNADLRNAKLYRVQLNRTNLTNANLCRTDLRDSQLKSTIFVDAILWKSDLSGASLQKADFTRANLSLANLQGADFKHANLNNADLSHANLRNAQNLTTEQVKAANNWDKAVYDPEFLIELGLF